MLLSCKMELTHAGGLITLWLVSAYPAVLEAIAMCSHPQKHFRYGSFSSAASIFLRDPNLAAHASVTPKNVPTHQVAITPPVQAESAIEWRTPGDEKRRNIQRRYGR